MMTVLPTAFAAVAIRFGSRLRRSPAVVADSSVREIAALRQYVPGALAERIARGQWIECGEREVSVLFIDIRDYTALAEILGPEETFRFVSRYTRVASRIVREYGGSVVEFNGDGMMAVFGAPNELPSKERNSLRAARAMLEAVESLDVSSTRSDLAAPVVRIGVATGQAFVGNIQAVDRLIWSAIGSTTNLASRLLNLARDFDASIAIDAATCLAVGTESEDLVCHRDVNIRGLSSTTDVYALPCEEGDLPYLPIGE